MNTGNIHIPTSNVKQLQQRFNFMPGQVMRGQVINVQGTQALLQFNAGFLTVQTQANLKKGDNLKLLVESVAPTRIKLKIMPENEAISPEKIVLLRMGIQPQEDVRNIISQLMKYQLTVNPEFIEGMSNLTRELKLSSDILPLFIWLKSLGIEVENEADIKDLVRLRDFLGGKLEETEQTNFFKFLNKTETQVLGGINIFGWPLGGNNHIYLLSKQSKKEMVDPDNCSLVIRVETKRFAELWFRLEHTANTLRVQLICSLDEQKVQIEPYLIKLQKNLESSGYKIDNITVEVRQVKNILDFLPSPDIKLAGINYWV